MPDENEVPRPTAFVILVVNDQSSLPTVLEKISKSKIPNASKLGNGAFYHEYRSVTNFSRSPLVEKQPEKIEINGVEFCKYPILLVPLAYKRKSIFLIGCRFTGALKEFILKHLETALQQSKISFGFLQIDLNQVKNALETGSNLKGRIKAISSRVDYFGGDGLEKIMLRGEDVFLSGKYNEIVRVLGVDSRSHVLHSVVLLLGAQREIRIALDKFGNFRIPLLSQQGDVEDMAEAMKFLIKYSIERAICPLRRIVPNDDE